MSKTAKASFSRKLGNRGFTVMELLVAMTLSSLIMAMTLGHVMQIREGYFDDVVRTKINSNLRSAMDILSMNIRQAGENLQTSFPVVTLTNSTASTSDILTLRRNLFQEVLTVCTALAAGGTTVNVSSSAVTNPECQAANVTALYNVFRTYRTGNSGSVRAYLYNRITGVGEFVNYTAEGSASGQYFVTVSGPQVAYPALTSNLYLLEEFRFSRNLAKDTIELVVNGQTDQPQAVAYSVTGFDVVLQMEDGSDLTSWAFGNPSTWRDISKVQVYLTGQETRKGRTISSGIQSAYFPRNVLSY